MQRNLTKPCILKKQIQKYSQQQELGSGMKSVSSNQLVKIKTVLAIRARTTSMGFREEYIQ
jgi:hypothetical protein